MVLGKRTDFSTLNIWYKTPLIQYNTHISDDGSPPNWVIIICITPPPPKEKKIPSGRKEDVCYDVLVLLHLWIIHSQMCIRALPPGETVLLRVLV